MYTLEILSAAADEAEAAVDWYEQEQPGLGQQFRKALSAGLDLLEDDLVTGSLMPGHLGEQGVRRLVLRRFPYDIIFLPETNLIIVLAFAHHSRLPGYWTDRARR